jgi:hypothetical protein
MLIWTTAAPDGYCHALLKIFDSTARLTMGVRKERGQVAVRARASLVRETMIQIDSIQPPSRNRVASREKVSSARSTRCQSP